MCVYVCPCSCGHVCICVCVGVEEGQRVGNRKLFGWNNVVFIFVRETNCLSSCYFCAHVLQQWHKTTACAIASCRGLLCGCILTSQNSTTISGKCPVFHVVKWVLARAQCSPTPTGVLQAGIPCHVFAHQSCSQHHHTACLHSHMYLYIVDLSRRFLMQNLTGSVLCDLDFIISVRSFI